jgi:hypothetical protein
LRCTWKHWRASLRGGFSQVLAFKSAHRTSVKRSRGGVFASVDAVHTHVANQSHKPCVWLQIHKSCGARSFNSRARDFALMCPPDRPRSARHPPFPTLGVRHSAHQTPRSLRTKHCHYPTKA